VEFRLGAVFQYFLTLSLHHSAWPDSRTTTERLVSTLNPLRGAIRSNRNTPTLPYPNPTFEHEHSLSAVANTLS
jgi:hypothetical protein